MPISTRYHCATPADICLACWKAESKVKIPLSGTQNIQAYSKNFLNHCFRTGFIHCAIFLLLRRISYSSFSCRLISLLSCSFRGSSLSRANWYPFFRTVWADHRFRTNSTFWKNRLRTTRKLISFLLHSLGGSSLSHKFHLLEKSTTHDIFASCVRSLSFFPRWKLSPDRNWTCSTDRYWQRQSKSIFLKNIDVDIAGVDPRTF